MASGDRRQFLKGVAAASSAATGFEAAVSAGSSPQQRQLSLALIGCGGRGRYLAGVFAANPGVKLSWLCDADAAGRDQLAKTTAGKPKTTGDLRQTLQDSEVDAVIVATPDHWHAPAAILACDAGKHVYVEKPCSHNIREGRLLVDAARRNRVVVQHGTQVRSTGMMIEAVKLLRQGVIGDVLVSKAWNIQRRSSIGHGQPGQPPKSLDYDTWIGPAPMQPYQKNRVHQGWHWWFDFGTGDMGNDGVHDIDYARWGLGVTTHPSTVTAIGGKYFFDDDQQFPDTQQVAFEYPGDGTQGQRRMLIYEQRLWSTNYPYNVDSGVEFYGTRGRMFLSRRGKIEVLDQRNQRVKTNVQPEVQNAEKHVVNFLACVRSGERPNGDIEIGHLTTTLCHLGNMATRLGRSLRFDPTSERVLGDKQADAMVGRDYREHWSVPAKT